MVAVGSGSVGEHHWQKTYNHSQRRHKNRAQTGYGSLYRGLNDAHTRASAFKREFHNKDGVLGKKAYEHDECDLEIYVVVNAHEAGEYERSHKTERHREYDGPRKHIALVLGTQKQIYEQEHNAEYVCGGAASCGGFFSCQA